MGLNMAESNDTYKKSLREGLTPTEYKVVDLYKHLFDVWGFVKDLKGRLEDTGSLGKFSKYKELIAADRKLGKYIGELQNVYSKDVESLVKSKHWIDDVINLFYKYVDPALSGAKEYAASEFRAERWKDDASGVLEKSNYMIEETSSIKKILYDLKEMPDVEPELKEKIKKSKPQPMTATPAVALTVVLVFGFVILTVMSIINTLQELSGEEVPVISTGFSVIPLGGFPTTGWGLVYIAAALSAITIYVAGKLMKRW